MYAACSVTGVTHPNSGAAPLVLSCGGSLALAVADPRSLARRRLRSDSGARRLLGTQRLARWSFEAERRGLDHGSGRVLDKRVQRHKRMRHGLWWPLRRPRARVASAEHHNRDDPSGRAWHTDRAR